MINKTNRLTKQRGNEVSEIGALGDYPYFVLRNEITSGYNNYSRELLEIAQNYLDYQNGAKFQPEGSLGDYIPSNIRFKLSALLINKEARFMFSQTPDINVVAENPTGEEEETKQIQTYQKIIDKVLENSAFSKRILQSAKDCFIGKRIAMLADISEEDGILLHFYNSLQFYYETEYGSDKLSKFVSFEQVSKSAQSKQRKYLVNKYENINGVVYMSSILYNASGGIEEELITKTEIGLDYIPAVIVFNDGTLEDKQGVSEIGDLYEYESGYSKLANADYDSDKQGMNPIKYLVDMNERTTKGLSTKAGSLWDLESSQTIVDKKPSIGTLSPDLQHTEAVKTTLDRIKTMMYSQVDVPNISEETMVGTITSGKALKTLYYPLTVRCDEKNKTWLPSIKFMAKAVIDLARLNEDVIKQVYLVESFGELQYDIFVVPNYALIDDEVEEKELDLQEINANTRSRFSYIKKWRKDEFSNDEAIEQELMQIAIEQNMFDTMSANTQVQTELNNRSATEKVEQNLEDVKTKEKLSSIGQVIDIED